MKNEDLIKLANQWMDAFNKKDLEALLALYHEDAQHYSPKLKARQPETKGLIQHKTNLRNWWQDAFNRLPSLQYEDLYVGEMLEVKQGLIYYSSVFHR